MNIHRLVSSPHRLVVLALTALLLGGVLGCKDPKENEKRLAASQAKKVAREQAEAKEAARREAEVKAHQEAEEAARKRAAMVQESTGAVGVGEPLEPFLKTEALSEDAALRGGLERLARERPTKALTALLTKDKAAGKAAVLRAMWHKTGNIRSQAPALLTLTGAKGPEVIAAFKRSLRTEPDRDVRALVAKALVTLHLPPLGPVLIELLQKDREAQVRANAAYALGAMGYKPAVQALVAALADKETWVRLRSVTALRRLKARAAVLSLQRTLSDPNVLVRQAAVRALKAVTGKRYKEKAPRMTL